MTYSVFKYKSKTKLTVKLLFFFKLIESFKQLKKAASPSLFFIDELYSFFKSTFYSRILYQKKFYVKTITKRQSYAESTGFRQPYFKGSQEPSSVPNRKLLKIFLSMNTWIPTRTIKVNHTFSAIFFFDNNSNAGLFNLSKISSVWTNLSTFISNLFYYNEGHLTFSNPYLKYEVLSLNWFALGNLKNIWRFTNRFTFFLNSETSLENHYFFKYLLALNYKIVFLVDINYHRKTVHYLLKNKFISVGPVPISDNFYLLTVSLPVSSNSVFSNLFFIRLVLKIRKSSLRFKWLERTRYLPLLL